MPRTNIFLSSSTVPTTSNGSIVNMSLIEPLDVYNKLIRVLGASIWYSFPNIDAPFNTIGFTYNSIPYVMNFTKGLYGIADINESVIQNLATLALPTNLFTFIPDEATSLVTMLIEANSLAFSITYSSPSNLMLSTLLGFTQVGTITTTSTTYIDSLSRASLNRVSSIYVHASFAYGSYYNNVNGSTIIASIPINVSPGSQITYEPSNPISCSCNGGNISSYSIWLTDQSGLPLDLNGESFTVSIELIDK